MIDTFVNDVRTKANGHWEAILQRLGIPTNRTEDECPACGGKTRYRFDDRDSRGTYHCSHCGAGSGLDLVMKVNQCGVREAAALVADVMALPLPEPKPAREKPQIAIADKVAALVAKSAPGQSHYLTAKGLQCTFPMLSDGSMLVGLTNADAEITGAQVIKPDGSKRLVAGSVKKGSFCVVNLQCSPDVVIIAEGVATALSAHLIHPDALNVAAIDAGNLLAVAEAMRRTYPEAQIIIAADNDIKPGEPNTGKVAAEKTAKSVSGWLTLPPTDSKADWDDYRQQNGIEAAAQAFTAGMYQPQGERVKPTLTIVEGGKPLTKPKDDMKPYVDERRGGMFWVEPKLDKETGEITEKESWLSAPLAVTGIGEDENERYLVLSWWPEGGNRERIEALPMRDIGEREGWAKLRAGGLSITAKSSLRAILADHLQRSGNREMWAIASASGWQCGAYIMPDGEVIGEPKTPVLFNGRSAAAKGYTVKGTAESWRENVAMLAQGNPSMMLGIACALAAPLIGIAGADGFGVHLFGGSSAGKTTTGNAASTVYGEPDALKLTWYSTALGLVNEAAAHNDGFMPLDEIGQGSNRRAVADAAYALFNGVGKIQGAKEGGNRDVKRWRAMAFSTGEIDMESYIRADGGKVNAGQLVRLLNVPISKAAVYHGHADGKAHADAMRDACKDHYGAVGRAWIKQLASQKDASGEAVRVAERRWLGLLPEEASEQVRRVASRFAVLEAALILSLSLTGWEAQECRDALQHSFNAWVNEFGMGNREAKAWVEQAEAFLQRYGYSRYLPYQNTDPRDLPIKDLAGYRVKSRTGEEMIFHTWPSVFKDEIAIGANYIAFAQVLADAGMLDKPKKGITKKTLVHEGKQCHFVVMTLPVDDEE
ncbi:DUF927 domain-containing protein [Serratia fonticola]|uniref:DUF927 domain-containing protein n=1 Tax=Serratia fonticola TaxID=47917 RepID=UPI0027EEB509|nr:DUF927 domain-containing protein [Serratia fonticola]MDQ7209881.1 DUF927 domain-containing protein [Serratia fonticola]HBE9079251.1 DUF927 domain-containing protein [Serratia fonticola]HBE9091623.1 DUF927 domain-containing protein [Serratia fonticola]HBE9151024.1 DUF927 domain-containing protein [Serratia fonticola]